MSRFHEWAYDLANCKGTCPSAYINFKSKKDKVPRGVERHKKGNILLRIFHNNCKKKKEYSLIVYSEL